MNAISALQPVAAGIWSDGETPHLIGGRDRTSGRITFPMPSGAHSELYEAVALPREGRLWSWTSQDFEPKRPPYDGPVPFAPYIVGYVELPDAVIVESRIVGVLQADMQIGMPLSLTIIDFGDGRSCFAFAPLTGSNA
jgi:uncharacterized protein